MSSRISWDRYEVALLLKAYEHIVGGSDINTEAAKLSAALRGLAIHRGILIDETYRNVNGMKMQFANLQYLFTNGSKGLSGASALIRQMYELYMTNPAEYQVILEWANRMTGTPPMSVEDAFFAYAKDKTPLPTQMLVEYLQKAADYCHLKQPLLGMTDTKAVHKAQQKVVEGKLLRFRFRKDAQAIRKVAQLYYTFIRSYFKHEENAIPKSVDLVKEFVVEQKTMEEKFDISDFRCKLDKSYKPFLLSVKKLAASTAAQYSQSIEAVERFIRERGLDCTLDTDDPDEVQRIYDVLMGRKDFADWNNQRHHQYSAALAQYVAYLHQDVVDAKDTGTLNAMTIKDVVIKVLRDAGKPLTMPEIVQRIEAGQLYKFHSSNPTQIVYQGIRRYCKGMKAPDHAPVDLFDRFTDETGQIRYMLIYEGQEVTGSTQTQAIVSADIRWLSILQDSFPDGYILNDFLGQFQAAAFWQERYGEECPIQGNAIDAAMKAVGVVRDGRVVMKSDEDKELISTICAEINDILSYYTAVYRTCIYDRHREQLAACSIYTELAMTQQILYEAKDSFYSVNQTFAKRGQFASVVQDVRKVLRNHGGPMPVSDIANVLWFIPYDTIYHYLLIDDESLNIGNSTWMLAEHFPLTREDAGKIGDMLDEYFLTNDYVRAADLIPLLKDRLPGMADDLREMNYMAIYNIVAYYLRDQFSFTKAIISPKGSAVDFTGLFRSFAAEQNTFTLADLNMFASELDLPIYWESTYAGGAVRVSKTDFVNRRFINFDVDAIDEVLQDFCPDDYLPLMAVSSATMMHLPSCGYQWNGYLLQSYVFGFSKVFGLSYSSFGKTGYYGAMVRRSCKTISNYGSLVERVLTDDDTWETAADALDVLVKNGYQALRKYKGIDTAVAKAKQNKLSSDDRG
ncbi:hypothetical protein [Acutalibacter muris]|uniref:hypothetical protein n=1 Tax=Acutalibacter muris TaxID=1796620 RepID=UPI0026F3C930|nr:hypothetical protein [Acutalibacter muris]